MKCKIKGCNIITDHEEIDIDNLFSQDTIKFANTKADSYYKAIPLINEIFGAYIIPYNNLTNFIKGKNIKLIDISDANDKMTALVNACKTNGIINITGRGKYPNKCKIVINKILTFAYLFVTQLRQSYRPNVKLNNKVVFLRTRGAQNKFRNIDDIDKFFEDSPGLGSMYKQHKLSKRLSLLLDAIKLAKKYEHELELALKEYDFKDFIQVAKLYYSKRLLHTAFYFLVEDEILSESGYEMLYTGNNLDRFAFNEEELAKKTGAKLIVIPHGIEYGYKFPKGFIGDVFYTCTSNASIYLNYLYNTNKYVFSEEVGNLMFKLDAPLPDMPRVVYFTEPREYYVNVDIVKKLNEFMRHSNIQLYVKLHPADKRNNYKELFSMGIKEIVDFQEALVGNICISRKSTTLLEAVYNKGVAVAIITNEKDKAIYNSFPSLKDDSILCFYSADEAANYIVNMHCDLQAKRYIQ